MKGWCSQFQLTSETGAHVMDLNELGEHLLRGGAATLNHPAKYSVPEGGMVAPARFAGRAGSEFVFEQRFTEGEFRQTVLIDSKQSQANRSEEGLLDDRRASGPALQVPVISVGYPSGTLLDLQLPHRGFDAHVRAATQDGESVVSMEWYRGFRDATLADLSPVFVASPATIAFGGWDSTRKSGQLRLRSHFVSELFGVVSEDDDKRLSRRSGARLDPLGQNFHLEPDEMEQLLDVQRPEMSENTASRIKKEIDKARKAGKAVSASSLGLGGIPPSLETPFGVSVSEVRRARTYSLAGLRRLRFGGAPDEDAAARRALLALLLLGSSYADADPEIRAYCDLSSPRGKVFLDDEAVEMDLSIDACSEFLRAAIDGLPKRLAWTGQQVQLDGRPELDRAAVDADSDAEAG